MKKLLLTLLTGLVTLGVSAQCMMSPPIVTHVSCGATNDGSITFVLQCPTTSTFVWEDASTGGIPRTGLTCGTYAVTITDQFGVSTFPSITVYCPDPPTLTNINVGNNVCDSDCNGSISFNTTSNGSGITGYVWSGGLGSGSGAPVPVTNVCNGTYTVTITQNSGCDLVKTFNVIATQPITNTATYQNNYCANTCTAYINVNASSPSGVSYLWSTGQTTNQISNLCDGPYSVTITNGAGCTKVRNFTILTDPTLNTNWQKNTENPTGQNDVVKRTLTDDQGNLYVMGEFMMETILDGYMVNSGGINNQKGIFVAKYRPCGDLDWVVNSQNFSSYYDIEGFDIDFSTLNNVNYITLFAKWDNTNLNTQEYSFVSSNGSSNSFTNQGTNRDVFSISFDVGSGTIPISNIGTDYLLDYSDRLTAGKVTGNSAYIGGQIGGQATVKWYSISGTPNWISNVIEDLNGGNIIADFEVDGTNSYIIAAINLETSSAILDPFNPTPISLQGDAIIVIAPVSTSILPPTFINPAYGSDITINDINMNLAVFSRVTAVGEFKGQAPGWQSGSIPINSAIKTAIIAQFDVSNLGSPVTYQMDGQLQSASAMAVTTSPDRILVTGLMEGNAAEILTTSGMISTQTNSPFGVKTMWVAEFDASNVNGMWLIGTDGMEDMLVNDISYHYTTGLFYTGGQYKDDISLPPFSDLFFPNPGTGQKLGFIIRGGDQYMAGQGAFYKTSTNDDVVNSEIIEKEVFIIYPNPSNGIFNIAFTSESLDNVQISIFSLTGQQVYSNSWNKSSQVLETVIQPINMATGFYTIQLKQGSNVSYQKLIVE